MQFKRQTGHSPIDYLIQTRIAKARNLLLRSDATLSEIAAEVGYSDVYYFSRIFKKHVGISPIQYQRKMREEARTEDRPLVISESSIGRRWKSGYIDYENHYQYIDGGSTPMKRRKTSSSMIMVALLSITMLLAACSSGTATTPANLAKERVPVPITAVRQYHQTQEARRTKTMKHARSQRLRAT